MARFVTLTSGCGTRISINVDTIQRVVEPSKDIEDGTYIWVEGRQERVAESYEEVMRRIERLRTEEIHREWLVQDMTRSDSWTTATTQELSTKETADWVALQTL